MDMNKDKDTKKINSDNENLNITDETRDTTENIEENTSKVENEAENAETDDAKAQENQEKKEKPSKPKKEIGTKLKNYTKTTKFRKGGMSAAFTAGFIVIVILINIIVGALSDRFPSMNIDLTQGGMNTLSEKACEVVDKVKTPTEINIIGTESQIKNDIILAEYGIKYSQVSELASKMAERNQNIKVNYIDLDKNPTFANEYQNEDIMTGSVVVKTDKRYRVLTYTDLFDIRYNQAGTGYDSYSMVDSALSSGINSAIADTISTAAFDTAHSEAMDVTTYKNLLKNNSFETNDINLLTDSIPKDVKLLVLGCPATDFTKDEIKKLDDFLSSSDIPGDRSVMVTFDPAQKDMPNLSEFLKEWGIEVPKSVIVETDQSKYVINDPSSIFSNLQSEPKISSDTDYGYFLMPRSNPLNILYETKGTRRTYPLSKSSDTCILVDNNTKEDDNPPKKSYNTAVLSQDIVKSGDKEYKANVIAMGSTAMFSTELLSANTFGNAKYVVDLSKYGTGNADEATAITQVPVQMNVADITLSTGMSIFLGIGIFTFLIPIIIAIAGIYVYRKRRHL